MSSGKWQPLCLGLNVLKGGVTFFWKPWHITCTILTWFNIESLLTSCWRKFRPSEQTTGTITEKCFNSLGPGVCWCNFEYVIFKQILATVSLIAWVFVITLLVPRGECCRTTLVLESKGLNSWSPQAINSLWLCDAILHHRSGSPLVQVTACCLTAPSHYLNQCWLNISDGQWYSHKSNFTRDTSAINH